MRRIGKVFLLGVVVGLVVAAVRALRGDGRPASAPALSPAPRALPDVAPAATPAVERSATPAVEAPAPSEPAPTVEPSLPPEPAVVEVAVVEGRGADDGGGDEEGATWVPPVDGICPDGFPIKVKVSSGIFHQPGGLSYARTRPDRCYPTAAAAEADGYRPALR